MRTLVLFVSLALALAATAGCAGGSAVDGGCHRAACLPDAGEDAPASDLGATDLGTPAPDAGTTDLGTPVPDAGATDLGPPDLGVDLGAGIGGLWMLPPPYTTWTEYDRGESGTTAYAPSGPVEEAFALDGCDEAYVLTHAFYSVLRLSDHTWVRGGLRATIFPELGGMRVSMASSVGPRDFVCSGTANYDVTMLVGADAYLYHFTKGAGFGFNRTVAAPWATDAMAPDTADVVADFFTFDDSARWLMGSPHDVCSSAPSMPTPTDVYGPYTAVFTADSVYLQDDGWCFSFVRHVPTAAFTPFAVPGAPAPSQIGAAFYADSTLWVVRE